MWRSKKCLECGNYRPEQNMVPVYSKKAGAIMGYLCKSCAKKKAAEVEAGDLSVYPASCAGHD